MILTVKSRLTLVTWINDAFEAILEFEGVSKTKSSIEDTHLAILF